MRKFREDKAIDIVFKDGKFYAMMDLDDEEVFDANGEKIDCDIRKFIKTTVLNPACKSFPLRALTDDVVEDFVPQVIQDKISL